jgi:hypothetical protein
VGLSQHTDALCKRENRDRLRHAHRSRRKRVAPFAGGEAYNKQTVADLDAETLGFGAASESFALIRPAGQICRRFAS